MSTNKFISYLLPKTLTKVRTSLGQFIEVKMENGVKVLNSENTNYSYGSLHHIMYKGIEEVLKYKKPANVLMLGLGGGSALKIMADKFNWEFKVTVVEIDSDVISMAINHFNLEHYTNIQILNHDAKSVVHNFEQNSFDLIIDDVFWDINIPDFCFSEEYLQANCDLLCDEGVYFRNTMGENQESIFRYEEVLAKIFPFYYHTRDRKYGNRIFYCMKRNPSQNANRFKK